MVSNSGLQRMILFRGVVLKDMDRLKRRADEEVAMRCHRCRGSMIYEKFHDEDDEYFAWRCIVCGEMIDHVILKNRYQQN